MVSCHLRCRRGSAVIMFYMISTVSYYINSTDVQKHVELFQLIRRETYLDA